MDGLDLDLFNKEQRPFNYDGDCLDFWAYLKETWKIDTSDEDYERRRDDQLEKEMEEELLFDYEYCDD